MVYPRSAILRCRPGSNKMIKSGPILHNRLETVRLRPAYLLGVATALLGFVISAAADNMVTIAGNGSEGFSGDGGNSGWRRRICCAAAIASPLANIS